MFYGLFIIVLYFRLIYVDWLELRISEILWILLCLSYAYYTLCCLRNDPLSLNIKLFFTRSNITGLHFAFERAQISFATLKNNWNIVVRNLHLRFHCWSAISKADNLSNNHKHATMDENCLPQGKATRVCILAHRTLVVVIPRSKKKIRSLNVT